MHEAALKAQAKKMNVDSLRSNADDGKESAEIRIAKVGLEISKNIDRKVSRDFVVLSGFGGWACRHQFVMST